ncbi:MAG TPA: glycosyltransferase family 1 protein [Myxococcales bacterium]|nr:glycosyltransferase family 1 protein [Myxococcales bacterium]
MLSSARASNVRKSPKRVVLGYASGTPTHDRDLSSIEDGIIWTLGRYNHVDVHLMGYIRKSQRLARFGTRVQRRPFVAWHALPQRLRDIDINLAPFCLDSEFSNGKSALKYMEAGLVGVPTIASPMPAYLNTIESGNNGFIAANDMEWRDHLQYLIENEQARNEMGQAAQATVQKTDSLQNRAQTLKKILKKVGSKPASPARA